MTITLNFSKSVTASTTEATAVTQTLTGVIGTIKKVTVHFPAGCVGKVHVKFFKNNIQIVPANSNGAIIGDNERSPIELELDILETPLDITMKAWNTDDVAHNIDAIMIIQPLRRVQL